MIEHIAACGSTNAELSARLAGGEAIAEAHWLIADRQTAGRGRQGRAWHDGRGNFMGSTIVRLAPGDPPAPTLALVAGLAVLAAVAPHLPAPHHPQLKWPNDVLVNGAKLAGILLERAGDAVIVGIGVNLASVPALAEKATAALADFAEAPARDAFAAELAASFAAELARWRSLGLAAAVARWQAHAHPLGTALRVGELGGGSLSGRFAGLGTDGALRLALADGTERILHTGDVDFA